MLKTRLGPFPSFLSEQGQLKYNVVMGNFGEVTKIQVLFSWHESRI